MIASAEWKQGMIFEGRSASGHSITFDATAEHAAGPSPMEAGLAAMRLSPGGRSVGGYFS